MSYTAPPPNYLPPPAEPVLPAGAVAATQKGYAAIPTSDPDAPAAGPSGGSGGGGGNSYWVAGGRRDNDVPDDFKFGTTVAESSLEIRMAFIRKVYSILFVQLLATGIVGWAMSTTRAREVVLSHPGLLLLPLLGSFISLFLVYWKRHSSPANFILLGVFTLCEAFTLGPAVAMIERREVVLQALLITTVVFLGLTLFTFQSKWDFSGMGPILMLCLWLLIGMGFVGLIFGGWSRTTDLVYGIIGCVIFSGFIIYDTYLIQHRLSPDEWLMASISLYLDFINLFLSILRVLNDLNDR